MPEQLGKNAVFGRTENGAVDAHAGEHDHRPRPPVGWESKASVAPVIGRTSTALIVMITVRLLMRSAKKPATKEVRTSGKVKTTMAIVV